MRTDRIWCLPAGIQCVLTIAVALVMIAVAPSVAQQTSALTGQEYLDRVAREDAETQATLREMFPESEGYVVVGPPAMDDRFFRIICQDLDVVERTWKRLEADDSLLIMHLVRGEKTTLASIAASFLLDDGFVIVAFLTPQQLRFRIWDQSAAALGIAENDERYWRYRVAVADYLHEIDLGHVEVDAPPATEFGLPETADIYAPRPDYVIEGYDNYKAFLLSHGDIYTDFAKGVAAFIPGDSLLAALKAGAPHCAFPNKEHPMLQYEYREFFERGGDVAVMQTLTAEGFDTLVTGEYFFAVGMNGTIRFGRELPREEVRRLEEESGHKVPRANHAFLFPGEPVRTAGAFFIDRDSLPHLVKVNAQSGHYFYSNVTPTIREDIAERSDSYLLTLGHLFNALDSLGISYDSVLISKL